MGKSPVQQNIIEALQQFLTSYTAQAGGKLRLLIAVSGGADSMALLGAALQLHNPAGIQVQAAHLNHHPESAEAAFRARLVADYCREHEVVCSVDTLQELPPHGVSAEDWMRQERYTFLRHTARLAGAEFILTGHHADDQAETVLQRVVTGAGLRGLRGIRASTGGILRPLLAFHKHDLIQFCKNMGIPYADDPSNQDQRSIRNRIRHSVIPYLERELNPDISGALVRLGRRMDEADEVIDAEVDACWDKSVLNFQKGKIILDLKVILTYFTVIQKYTIQRALEVVSGTEIDLSTAEMDRIETFLRESRTGSFLEFGEGIKLVRDRQTVIGYQTGDKQVEYTLIPGENRTLDKLGHQAEWLPTIEPPLSSGSDQSADLQIPESNVPLILRYARPGDRFQPLGAPGEKRLFRFLADRKVPRFDKLRTLVLERDGAIIWVVGHRISEQARIRNGQAHSWRLRLIPLQSSSTQRT